MVGNDTFSQKIDYFSFFSFEILNLKGHQNCITGKRVTAIFLNWGIFPIERSGGGSVIKGAYPV